MARMNDKAALVIGGAKGIGFATARALAEEHDAILVSPGPGAPARPVHKGASGGELSRLALAIAVCSLAGRQADGGSAPTLIFDEIDAGIGGAVAEIVGRVEGLHDVVG